MFSCGKTLSRIKCEFVVGNVWGIVCSHCSTMTGSARNWPTAPKSADDDTPGMTAEVDFDYLCSARGRAEMKQTINTRKQVGDIDRVNELYEKCLSCDWRDSDLKRALIEEASRLPNRCHPVVFTYGKEPFVTDVVGDRIKTFDENFKPKQFDEMAESVGCLRRKGLGPFVGHRSYFLVDSLADLEDALCKYALSYLLKRNFSLVSVPDILRREVIEGCGMPLGGERTQLYALNKEYYGESFLSGTSEMALAALHANNQFSEAELPLKLMAVSRCFRAEISNLKQERGIYRVHEFTKVEMFALTANETGCESDRMLDQFVSYQKEMFAELGLHFQVLDMPAHELGAPAYRKFDIEAWMPGRQLYGEISSASSCTDYQSRRLNIRYTSNGGVRKHVHTVNGTACAVPRMLIALLETYQQSDATVFIPSVLRPYFNNHSKLPPLSAFKLRVLRKADGSG